MAKKDIYTCDPDKISINTFSSKQKSFTAANNNYKGSYLNTAGNQTVKKLNSTVSSYYQQLDSLYNGLIKYISNYIRSVKNLEKSLQSGSLSEEEEIEVRATINAVNEILNGTEPSDIVINPLTGEVSVNYDSSKYRQYNIDPKMNGSLTSESTKIANRDALYGAHITNPKLMTFLDAWTLVPFEVGSVEKYTQEQSQKIQEIKGKNVGANILGTAAGVLTFAVIPGMSVEGAFSKLAIQTGAKSIAKAECKSGLSKLLLSVGKQELIDAPMNLSMAFKEAYDMNTGKINWGTFVKSMGLNVGFDLGFRGIGSLGKRIINAKSVKMGLENIDELIDVKKGISAASDEVKTIKYSKYTTEQILANKDYKNLCNRFLDIADDETTKKQLKSILYDGGYKDLSVSSGMTRSNYILEGQKRASMANIAISDSETFKYLVDNDINLFHGTGVEALPGVMDNGLLSLRESDNIGNKILTGEVWSRGPEKRAFVSFTDDIGLAQDYASTSNSKIPIIFGTTSADAKKLGGFTVSSDLAEVGIMNRVPKEDIKVIMTTADNVPTVKKIVGDEIPVLPISHADDKFYYMDDFGDVIIDEQKYNALKMKPSFESTRLTKNIVDPLSNNDTVLKSRIVSGNGAGLKSTTFTGATGVKSLKEYEFNPNILRKKLIKNIDPRVQYDPQVEEIDKYVKFINDTDAKKLEEIRSKQIKLKHEYDASLLDARMKLESVDPKLIDLYTEGKKSLQEYRWYQGYEEHNFVHVTRVANDSADTARVLNELIDSGELKGVAKVDPDFVYKTGLNHDTGMRKGGYLIHSELDANGNLTGRRFFKKITDEFLDDSKAVEKAIRDNHSLNSAIDALTTLRRIYGDDAEEAACVILLHSKSNSGVREVTTENMSNMIRKLWHGSNDVVDANGNVLYKFDISKLIEVDELGNPLYKSGTKDFIFKPGVEGRLTTSAMALRIGDAHAVKTGFNQYGEQIKKLPLVGDVNNPNSFLIYTENELGNKRFFELGDKGIEFTRGIILGEKNSYATVPKIEMSNEGKKLVFDHYVRSSDTIEKTWKHGVMEKFGEYQSFATVNGLKMKVNVIIDSELTKEYKPTLIEEYKRIAQSYSLKPIDKKFPVLSNSIKDTKGTKAALNEDWLEITVNNQSIKK